MPKPSEMRWTWEPGVDGKVTCSVCGRRITLTGPASRHSGMHKLSWHVACEGNDNPTHSHQIPPER